VVLRLTNQENGLATRARFPIRARVAPGRAQVGEAGTSL